MISLIKFISWLRSIFPLQGRGVDVQKDEPSRKIVSFRKCSKTISLSKGEMYKSDTKYLF